MLKPGVERLREMLIRHEGLRLKPYRCTAGKLTVGVGRNLDDVGISYQEAMLLLTNDIERVHREAIENFPWFKSLSVERQDVVLNMLFNLGLSRFKGFKKLIEALRDQNYEKASQEMLSSLWAKQVGVRAKELSQMMLLGRYL